MPDMQKRIESMYRSDVSGALLLVALLWATILFVLWMTWPFIPNEGIRIVVLVAATAVLLFNTGAIVAMIRHYSEDKTFIYTLDIENQDANRNKSV